MDRKEKAGITMTRHLEIGLLTLAACAALACDSGATAQLDQTDSHEPQSNADERSPEDIARAFVEAGNAEDKEEFLSLMTTKARAGMESGDGRRWARA